MTYKVWAAFRLDSRGDIHMICRYDSKPPAEQIQIMCAIVPKLYALKEISIEVEQGEGLTDA